MQIAELPMAVWATILVLVVPHVGHLPHIPGEREEDRVDRLDRLEDREEDLLDRDAERLRVEDRGMFLRSDNLS